MNMDMYVRNKGLCILCFSNAGTFENAKYNKSVIRGELFYRTSGTLKYPQKICWQLWVVIYRYALS